MPKRTPIYWRGDPPRAYGNFRGFEDVGGRQEPLIPEGERLATTDAEVAQALYAKRLTYYVERRKGKQTGHVFNVPAAVPLGVAARDHLIGKKQRAEGTDQWLGEVEAYLRRATEHFGEARDLRSVRVADVKAYAAWLRTLPNGRGGVMSWGNVRHHLNALSNLYAGLIEGEQLEANPLSAWRKKPRAERREARWLEVHDCALLLEAARLYRPEQPKGGRRPMPFAYALVAALALTGGRVSEVTGLELDDISFERKTVTFRPNMWRRLKTVTSHRVVPLWPQLAKVLAPYIAARRKEGGRLLFPSYRTGEETMLTDFRKLLDAVAGTAAWKAGEIRGKMFRHTYCAARLQTLDNGAAVSVYTVARELGHGGDAMVKQVYGHLGDVRQRSAAVEYRVQKHAAILIPRLAALRAKVGCANLARKEAAAVA
ncbi:MAG TPA: site-specific integrase [Gemmatimonadales bacterium]|nr:site-specific integrase [Gemmatimonadales bacterium]